MPEESEKSKRSWWQTVPGTLTAIAGLITAITGLLVALHQAGLFREEGTSPNGEEGKQSTVSVPRLPKDSIQKNKNEVAAPSAKLQPKLGDEISTAQWVFAVRDIRETDEYVERYYQMERIIRPKGKSDTLIVVDARLKNRLQRTQSPILTERKPGNTGLIDYEGRSYQPLDYDARQARDKIQSYEGEPLLPGTMTDFALVFSVPKGTNPKTLIFTAETYLDRGAKDVQVSLD